PYGPPGSRLYRTGDLARRLPNGTLDFLGRADNQVKIRGYRIELGEIEARLREHPTVSDTVVTVREPSPGVKHIVAYLVTDIPIDAAALREHLAADLPDYMLPTAYTAIDHIPLTGNGKVDHRALPAPELSGSAGGARTAPRTPVERDLAATWGQVLGLEHLGVEETFFDLGGDSIAAVRLVGALRAAGYELSVRDVFEHRTVADLANLLSGQTAGQSLIQAVALFALISDEDRTTLPAGITDAYPLSQIQTGMLVEMLAARDDRGTRTRTPYHNVDSLRVPDRHPFSAEALREALDVLAARHDALRTSMHLDGYSQPLQLVHDTAELPLTVHDLRGLDAEEQTRRRTEDLARERADLFELSAAPLLRVQVHIENDEAWRLTVSHCHAITEGWTLSLLVTEIVECYQHLRDGRELPEYQAPSVRYADFIAAELESLASPEDRAFWQDVVDGHAPLRLPADWSQADAPTGVRHGRQVPFADLEDALRALALKANTSLKSVLLAAHLKVMSSLTADDAFHTGVVFHGRLEAPGADRVLGMHLNTLPFPAHRPTGTWRQLVEHVYAQEAEIWTHRRYPLPAVQREAGNGQRLIPVMFEQQNFEQLDPTTNNNGTDTGTGGNEFDLGIIAADGALSLGTTTAVLSAVALERLASMYRQVLEAMAADPDGDATTTHLPADTLEPLHGHHTEWPGTSPLHLFQTHAATTPHATAVICGDDQLTYQELDERSNQLAHHLRALGVTPGDHIGICLDRSPAVLTAMLATWKAGAAYIPVDPALPAERRHYMLTDATATILITDNDQDADQDTDTQDTAFTGQRVHPDHAQHHPTTPLHTPHDGDALAYLLYTSGSTGRPKGVMIPHGALHNLLSSVQNDIGVGVGVGVGRGGTWLASTSISFDISGLELFLPLTTGARIAMATSEQAKDPEALTRLIDTHRVTHVQLTPSGWRLLLTAGFDNHEVTALVGGEACTPDLANELTSRVQRLVNVYGPTETTIWSTYWEVPEETDTVAIGTPLANTHAHILDTNTQPVPDGIPGELHLAGTGLAHGYHHRPALTAEHFIPNPHGPAGSRLYRTGDLARRQPDGTLHYLGRIDTQVKIRGYRIELGEIEARLREHPAVHNTVVAAQEPSPGVKHIVAYLVTDTPIDAAALREHLATDLPDYMVPAIYIAIDRIPLTNSGKVDHRALPTPDTNALPTTRYIAPRTPVEERLAAIWSDVLGLPRIGIEDNFFDLGGDSLRAVRLVGAMRAVGYDVSIPDVFRHRTIAGLGAGLAGQAADESLIRAVAPFSLISDEDRAALPAGITDAYPLSQVQTGMLIEMLATADPAAGLYHNINSFRIPAEHAFSLPALRQAVDTVTRRHDILRTSMHLDGYTQPLQLVHETAELPVTVHDWRGIDTAQLHQALRDYAGQEWATGFDLTTAPLLRIAVHLEDDDAWRLTFSYNHAIAEGWSLNTLLMEIVECYQHLHDGRELPDHQPPSVRYADFIAAELESLASPEDRAFWQDVVDGHAPLRLPEGWGAKDGTGESLRLVTDYQDLEEDLRILAKQSDASFKSVLLAAHLKVMSSLTADDAFHTGVVFHGRLEAPGADRVLGMHLNTLPFPAHRPTGTWRQLVEHVYAQEAEIWTHRRYPLPAVQREAGNGQRLIPVMFEHLDFHQVDAETIDVGAGLGTGANEFAVSVVATGGTLVVKASTDSLGRAAAERLASMYRLVLESMAADPDGDATAARLPEVENNPVSRLRTEPTNQVLTLGMFEAQAAAKPRSVAVVCGDERLTYQELDERSNQLAHHLTSLGVTPGDHIGICLDRSPAVLTAMLATWKAGAAYIPVDPALPAERRHYMLTDATATILITDNDQDADQDTAFTGQRVHPDHAQHHPTTPLHTPHDGDALAYVLYTSGSTGRPKGVMIPHDALHNLLSSVQNDIGVGRGGTWLASTSISFDISGLELFLPLTTGARIAMATSEQAKDPEALTRLIDTHRVTHVQLTPSGWRLLLTAGFDNYAVTALVGGEACTPDLANELTSRVQRLVNVYGPTETTIWSTYWEVPEETDTVAIGIPLANTHAHILDTNTQPVADGIPGELHLAGTGLAHGYHHRPALTAERFIPNPFGPAGSRLYRTGDLARRQPDGTLDYLGRIDTQVKIRGYRIELGEIEARLREHPAVRDAVVTAHGQNEDKTLIGYIVTADGSPCPSEELRAHLTIALPDYMVPAAYIAIDRVPLTNSGKVDHRALPDPDASAFATSRYIAPRTPVEERLAAIWSDVLGLPRISIEDSFFELGGDSIRAIGLVGALRAAGYELSVRDVFQHRTVTDLANLLSGQTAGQSLIQAVAPFALISDEDRAALPADVVDAYPLSQIQTGMLVEMLTAATDSAGENLYHNINSFRIPAEHAFSLPALRQAVNTVTRRHDILRTSMHLDGYSQPLQLVHETAELPVTVHDWRGLDTTQLHQALRTFADQEWATGFELTTAPLLRISAHLEDDDAWRLTFSYNHAIAEGWTLNTLLMEIVECYQHLHDGRELPDHQPPSVRYADFIAAELESLTSHDSQAFWRQIVDRHTPVRLPAEWADERGDTADHHRALVPYRDVEAGLQRLAVQAKASLKSVLLAAHLKVLSTLTPEEAFHSGVVFHGRLEAPGADRVLGMHLNTLPFPAHRPTGTWRQLVEHVYAQEAEIWTHRHHPLPAIQRDTGTNERLLTTLFDHQDFHQIDSDTVDTDSTENAGANEFALSAIATGGTIKLVTTTGVLSEANLERLAAMYRLVLEAMAADAAGDATADCLSDAERERLLVEWAAGPDTQWPTGTTIELFERQAATTPDATAVIIGDRHLTYRETDERANQIAHHLRTLGAGPDTLIGVALDRDHHLLPALLGIWKTGAAYLPLDPALPTERLTYILDDTHTTTILTTTHHTPTLQTLPHPTTLITLDQHPNPTDHHPTTPLHTHHDPHNLAYVIYTSGSTGRPKGVQIHHHGLANYLNWTTHSYAPHGTTGAP
ncbi:amino acid adenylation domain-containing protein, partial [Kitasatospora sp. NPDC058170]|uniref:amino acid adenylation domain-containing protein n=1 Tax=Kitasatospora sp. NPDC058170 TaxID=3346364 RepID=UPI0036D76287